MSMKKILIVEDDENVLKLASILLTSKGYEVKGVTDGQAALDVLAEEKPDLVLLDILLPGVNGLEVCRRIKSDEKTKGLPVIMFTARTSPEDMARGKEVGANCYITKPFKAALAIGAVQKFIGD